VEIAKRIEVFEIMAGIMEFRKTWASTNWLDRGQNVAIEYRCTERHHDRLAVLANELILKVPRPLAARDNEALR
jgi:hypothetical protein